jgi:hypothetical protein
MELKDRSPVAQWESACPTSNGLRVQLLPGLYGDVAQRTEPHSSKVSRAGSNPAILVMGL